ncbi:MAG: type IV pilus twitching motility protein PilT [Candidatus Levybacteria bacterium]|nr:type IV pilus twitching motility protein PilT [Candidatus Levybacteria bacterium]
MVIQELLSLTIKNNASDLHLLVGTPPALRIDGSLRYLTSYPSLTKEIIEELVYSLMTPEQKELLLANKEIDFSFGLGETTQNDSGRFRINAYFQRGHLAAAFRYLPPVIKTIDQLQLPKACHDFVNMRQGFVLVTGPTGHGKSTTLAAIMNEINLTKSAHILTIEDPIEYIYPRGNSIMSQREMGSDTHSWSMALKSALREDPDVVLVGEMRDPETMQAALTIAETGHLVFATLHTNSAAQTIDRIVDAFPDHQRSQIRVQLAATLRGIISQRLIPRITGGRVLAVEILLGSSAVSSNIRDGKTHLIDSAIQTSKDAGMVTLEESLTVLVRSGQVSLEVAKGFANHPDELARLVG